MAEQDTPQETPANPEVPRRIVHVSNLPFDSTEYSVAELCKEYGEVAGVRMPMTSGHRCQGYCFVAFKTEEAGEAAIEGLTGRSIRGKAVIAAWAKRQNPIELYKMPKPTQEPPQKRYDDRNRDRLDRERRYDDRSHPPDGAERRYNEEYSRYRDDYSRVRESSPMRFRDYDREYRYLSTEGPQRRYMEEAERRFLEEYQLRRYDEETRRLYGDDIALRYREDMLLRRPDYTQHYR